MTQEYPRSRAWAMGGAAALIVPVLVLLFRELYISGNAVWNVVLTTMLLGFGIAAFLVQRHLLNHADAVGEARFDTRNKGNADG